jgi:hypothetical protein
VTHGVGSNRKKSPPCATTLRTEGIVIPVSRVLENDSWIRAGWVSAGVGGRRRRLHLGAYVVLSVVEGVFTWALESPQIVILLNP